MKNGTDAAAPIKNCLLFRFIFFSFSKYHSWFDSMSGEEYASPDSKNSGTGTAKRAIPQSIHDTVEFATALAAFACVAGINGTLRFHLRPLPEENGAEPDPGRTLLDGDVVVAAHPH